MDAVLKAVRGIKAGDALLDGDRIVWTALSDARHLHDTHVEIDVQYEQDGGCEAMLAERKHRDETI